MTAEELRELLEEVQRIRCETQTIELKKAEISYPTKIYDTLSAFSNQDEGGIILFGIYEAEDFALTGVYDPQDLMKHITEQCNQMTPIVRPVYTVLEQNEKILVSAEIPATDLADRPCFYAGKGRLKGSYIRVGDGDYPMEEYEIYSYDAFRHKTQDDVRALPQGSISALDSLLLEQYFGLLKANRPNLSTMTQADISELMSVTKDGIPTLWANFLFSPYPQAKFPQLCITAVVVAGNEVGEVGNEQERFLDNQRIEGRIDEMLQGALQFIAKNTKTKIIIDNETGKRNDKPQYPVIALREAILNALIHRDYSIHTEDKPIQLLIFPNRIELKNPGGLYGRLQLDQLGKVQPDTRNPSLVVAMERLGQTENRYSGIPTIKNALRNSDMPEAEFKVERGTFVVIFHDKSEISQESPANELSGKENSTEKNILEYCNEYRSREEIATFLGISSVSYGIKHYVTPLVNAGKMERLYPDKPRSKKQKYRSKP